MHSFIKKEGQSMIEAIIAISILTVGFLGIATLLGRSFVLNRTTSDNLTATYLASEGIELVKNMFDHDTYAGNGWGTCTDGSGVPHCTDATGAYTVDYLAATPQEIGVGAQCFSGVAVPPLKFDPATQSYGYGAGAASKFSRCIEITHNGEEITVNSMVEWSTNGANASLNLEDHFYHWNPS